MTSAINTSPINPNYPVPGINNSSQGFRDNFASIQTNLNTAANEITQLQNSSLLKQALPGQVLNNDMANTAIQNALTIGFRNTVTPMGANLSSGSTLYVNPQVSDVFWGTFQTSNVAVTANLNFEANSWFPANTSGNVTVQLTASNASPVVLQMPPQVVQTSNSGVNSLQNYTNGNVTIPAGSTVTYQFSSRDSGNTVYVQPLYAPQVAQAESRTFGTSTGQAGDTTGQLATDGSYLYVCTANFDGSTAIWKRVSLTSF